MRTPWQSASILFLACLACLAGCGEDDPIAGPEAPQPLAYFDVATGVGGRAVSATATLSLFVGPDHELFEVVLTGDDAGTTLTLGPDDGAGNLTRMATRATGRCSPQKC